VITFIFCWTPFHIRNIIQVWNIIPSANTWNIILDFANLGCAANSVLNPFIYSFLSTQFRQKLCMVINQRIRRPAGTQRPTSTATRLLLFKKFLGSVSAGSIRSRRGGNREVVSPTAPDRACVTPTLTTECSQLTQYNVVSKLLKNRLTYFFTGFECNWVHNPTFENFKQRQWPSRSMLRNPKRGQKRRQRKFRKFKPLFWTYLKSWKSISKNVNVFGFLKNATLSL